MKLRIIRILDWFDVHILNHRFRWVCDKIGSSDWWEIPPTPKVTVAYDKESDTLRIRIGDRAIEVTDNSNGVHVDYDRNRQVVGFEIMDASEYLNQINPQPKTSPSIEKGLYGEEKIKLTYIQKLLKALGVKYK